MKLLVHAGAKPEIADEVHGYCAADVAATEEVKEFFTTPEGGAYLQ